MKQHKNKFSPCLLLLLTTLFACDFGDTNVDPIRPSEVTSEELLPLAIAQAVRNMSSIGGRVTGVVVQQLKGADAQPQAYGQYLIDERTLDIFWKTGLYVGGMSTCQQIIDKSTIDGQGRFTAIAKILMAHNLGIATAYWGDIPYSEAFQGSMNTQPTYDRQADIYENIQGLLSDAILDLKQASDTTILPSDLIFQGNLQQWMATAYALKARYYLQLTKRVPEAAAQALSMIEAGAFKTASNQPDFYYQNNHTEANPFGLFLIERQGQVTLGDFLFELLNQSEDPRLAYLAQADGDLVQTPQNNLYWSQLSAPVPFISLSELKFIEAEAQLRLGAYTVAENLFKEAVSAHFEQMNIPNAVYTDFVETTIHFENATNAEERLERLIEQKYIALFAQGATEAWNDYRRTTYPNLLPPTDANLSFNPSNIIPRRYLYPVSERNTNALENEWAIEQQGGHLMDVDMWAFDDE